GLDSDLPNIFPSPPVMKPRKHPSEMRLAETVGKMIAIFPRKTRIFPTKKCFGAPQRPPTCANLEENAIADPRISPALEKCAAPHTTCPAGASAECKLQNADRRQAAQPAQSVARTKF